MFLFDLSFVTLKIGFPYVLLITGVRLVGLSFTLTALLIVYESHESSL